MRADVREAIDSARTVGMRRPLFYEVKPQRNHSVEHITELLRAVARELPADMTLGELLEEIGE